MASAKNNGGPESSEVKVSAFTALLESVLGGVDTFTLGAASKGCTLSSENASGAARIRALALSIGNLEDSVSVDFKAFTGACKGRTISLISSMAASGEIEIKSGTYKASIASTPLEGVKNAASLEAIAECTTDIVLSDDHKQILGEALRSTKIEKTYSGIVDTLVYVESTAKGILIASFEPSQVAFIRTRNTTAFPDCSMVLPSGVIAKVLLLPGSVRVMVNSSTAMFTSKVCDVLYPLPIDSVNAISSDQVLQLIKASKGGGHGNFSVSRNSLMNFLGNAESVIASSADVGVAAGTGSSVVVSVATAKGNIKEKFKGSVDRSFNISFPFLKAALARAGTKEDSLVSISIAESFVVLRNESDSSTYIAALSE